MRHVPAIAHLLAIVPGLVRLGFPLGDEAGCQDPFGFVESWGPAGGLSSASPSLRTVTHPSAVNRVNWVAKIFCHPSCAQCQPSGLPLPLAPLWLCPIPCLKPLRHFHSKLFLVTNLFLDVLNINQLPSPFNRATLNSAAEITGFCQHRDIKLLDWLSPKVYLSKTPTPSVSWDSWRGCLGR